MCLKWLLSSKSRDNKCIDIKYGSNGREKLELQKIQAKKNSQSKCWAQHCCPNSHGQSLMRDWSSTGLIVNKAVMQDLPTEYMILWWVVHMTDPHGNSQCNVYMYNQSTCIRHYMYNQSKCIFHYMYKQGTCIWHGYNMTSAITMQIIHIM